MNSVNAADLAWHMYKYVAGLQHEWITPNAMLYAWESDLLSVDRERSVWEIEIKCSRSDLLNDLKKAKHKQGLLLNGSFFEGTAKTFAQAVEQKRKLDGAKEIRRPNYFYFALPCAIYRKLPVGMLPSYAGVFTIDHQGRVFEERKPKQLHAKRMTREDLFGLARRMHHRYWNELRRARHLGE